MFGGYMCPTLAESCRTSIKTFPFKDINDSLMAVCCAHASQLKSLFSNRFSGDLQKLPKSVHVHG